MEALSYSPRDTTLQNAEAQLFDLTGQLLWAEPTTSYNDPSMATFAFFWSRVWGVFGHLTSESKGLQTQGLLLKCRNNNHLLELKVLPSKGFTAFPQQELFWDHFLTILYRLCEVADWQMLSMCRWGNPELRPIYASMLCNLCMIDYMQGLTSYYKILWFLSYNEKGQLKECSI